MFKDGTAVYWSDGDVLSDDPAHIAIISNRDYYLFTKDTRTVHVNGNPITGADPATFRVLNADFECSADAKHAYSRNSVVAGANPSVFPANRVVTRCDETSISFAD